MTLQKEERQAIIEYRKERALSTLQEAKDNANLGHWNLVANRLYYSIFYAGIALLLSHGISSSTHVGAKSLINLHFIKTGKLTPQEGSLLNTLFSMRQTGDYEDIYDWTKEDVEPLISKTEDLLARMLKLLN